MNQKPWPITQLYQQPVLKPAVLVIEPNPYHGELLPGFVNLLQSCGYEVHVLVRNEVAKENPFALFQPQEMPVIFRGNREEMREAASSDKTGRYEFVFFSTNVNWESGTENTSYIRYLNKMPVGRYGSMFVEHNLLYLNQDDAGKLFEEGRIFTLLEYLLHGKKTKMLNPHYFGKISVSKKPHIRKRILIIGSSSRDPKSLELLFSSVRQLNAEKKDMLEMSIVGGEVKVPEDLKTIITPLGRLTFGKYYQTVMEHDFLLTLVDQQSSDIIHTKYSHGTTTGTVQISLGFTRPMIIDKKHAEVYGFNESQSIIYNGEDLHRGLFEAVGLTEEEYAEKIDALKEKASRVYDTSLTELKDTISHFKKLHSIMPPKADIDFYLAEEREPIIGDQVKDIDRVRPVKAGMIERLFSKH